MQCLLFLAVIIGIDALVLRHDANTSGCTIPPGMRVVHNQAGYQMVVLGDNDIVSKSIAQKGYWEIHSPDDIARKAGTTLPKTGTLLDIGANIGDYTLLFANQGYNVIAVEPMTRNRAAIQASICLNPQFKDRIKIVPAALVAPDEVADQRCMIKSTNYNVNIGNGYLTCGKCKPGDVNSCAHSCAAGDANCEEVPVKTLDTVLAEVHASAVDVVKMDVEKYECHVFAGGQSLFTKFHPKLLKVETMWGKTGQCVHNEAAKHNYRTVHGHENTEMVSNGRVSLLFAQVP